MKGVRQDTKGLVKQDMQTMKGNDGKEKSMMKKGGMAKKKGGSCKK